MWFVLMFAQDCWLVGQENIDNIEVNDADRGDINNNYKVDSATSEVLDVYWYYTSRETFLIKTLKFYIIRKRDPATKQ